MASGAYNFSNVRVFCAETEIAIAAAHTRNSIVRAAKDLFIKLNRGNFIIYSSLSLKALTRAANLLALVREKSE